jgi:hypothetical protein
MEKASGDIRVVVLEGTPREKGRIHGETLRPIIDEAMGRWKALLQESAGMPAEEYLDRFLGSTDFMPSIARSAPDLLDEVRGLGEGAGIGFRDAYAYQLVDEQWIFTRQLQERREAATVNHCTAMGVFDRAEGPPILAQNMDLPKFYDGTQVLLRVKDGNSDVESLILSFAGIVATTGVNNRGVGVCCNTVSQLASSRDGLPVAFIVRTILEQDSRQDAVHFVKTVRHASEQNYTIGGPDGIVSLECSANKVAEFAPLPGRVYHTNHPLVNDDVEQRPNGPKVDVADPITGRQRPNTSIRFDAAARALANPQENMTIDAVQAILSNPESLVCAMRESPLPSFTGGSIVMELSVPPVVHLAPGPPAVTEYKTWTFT